VVSQRYQRLSTIVTTNRIFSEWQEVFPSATSIVAVIDRLCHNAEVLTIDAESYRNKETVERNTTRRAARRSRRKS
ncbi:ATP-binding protein, partial [Nannocystis exedens]